MRRIITARQQAELLAPWRTADAAAQDRIRRIMDDRWRKETTSPADLTQQHLEKIKNDPYNDGYEWSTRPQAGDDTIETGLEHLPQDTIPGMEHIRGESTRLWRGVPIDLSDPAFERVWGMTHGQGYAVLDHGMFPNEVFRYEDRGGKFDHPGLADAIMDGFNAKGGVGEHHSTDYDTADDYARGRADGSYLPGGGPHLPVLLDSDWNGRGESHDRSGSGNFSQEHEITLEHGKAPLDVRQINVPTGLDDDDWQDVQNGKNYRTTAALDAGVFLFVL